MNGIGLGIGLHGKNNVNPIIAGLFRRSYIAGRDGTLVCTRATQRVCPITGATLPVNTACQTSINLGGKRLPLFGAWGARTNLFLNSDAPATQDITVGTGSVTVFARTGTGYTVSVAAGTATGSGFGECAIGKPKTLTISGAGTITVTITGTPIGGKVSVEQAAFAGPYIPTAGIAVQHNEDSIVWTPPSALSAVSGEMLAIYAAHNWSVGAVGAHPGFVEPRLFASTVTDVDRLSRSISDICAKSDTTAQTAHTNGLAITNGNLYSRSQLWNAIGLYHYIGGSLAASDTTLSPPWNARTTVTIACGSVANRQWWGFVGVVYVPGGMTDAERAAIQKYVTGRSLTYAL